MLFSRIVSYIFHPLLMPSAALFILFQADSYFKFSTTAEFRNNLCMFVFVTTFVFPFIIGMILYRSKIIKSMEMDEVSERLLPFVLTLLFYIATLFMMHDIGLSYMIYASFLAATITVFLVFLIYWLLKWKISAHMAGLGGVVGAIIAFSYKLSSNMLFALIVFILISGMVGFARMQLNAHTPKQIYTGFLIGLVTQLLLIL